MLTKKQKEKIGSIAKKYDLKMILLFGSQVNGKSKPDSDFDIAYSANKPLNLEQKLDLNSELVDCLKNDRVDQVDLKTASPLLLSEIAQNSRLVFGKQIDYIKFKTRAFRVFTDSASLFRLQDSLVRKKHELLRQKIYDQ